MLLSVLFKDKNGNDFWLSLPVPDFIVSLQDVWLLGEPDKLKPMTARELETTHQQIDKLRSIKEIRQP